MPYRPEAELKRPDLKGEFLCGHCGKTFCHAASLNRHRLNFHGDDQQCQLCNVKIAAHETVRRHMAVNHQITRVFTCGCCNWTFPDKKELHAHNNSMLRTGHPGDARAIAISNRPPGSLAQAELKTEDGASLINRSSNFSSPPPKQPKKKVETTNVAQLLLKQMVTQQQAATAANSSGAASAVTPGIGNEWIQSFLLNNPNLLPLFSLLPGMKQEEPSAPSPLESLFASNNNNNTIKYELNVKTEPEETSSGPESGIGSGEDVTDSSPVPSDSSSKESSPPGDSKNFSRKRKSVDAIASFLFQRKQCASAAQ
ncbi:unnamed protein product [Auanema sp. JU1783]|nr:unnamed protein product [Auanema sp. JU1783]